MIRISWGWAPFIAIGCAAVANTALIIAVGRVRPQAVTDRPYLDSFHQDEVHAARQHFTERGLSVATVPSRSGITVRLIGVSSGLTAVELDCYRPSDRDLDRHLTWPTPGEPLQVLLPAPGRWKLQVRGLLDGRAVQAEFDVENSIGS